MGRKGECNQHIFPNLTQSNYYEYEPKLHLIEKTNKMSNKALKTQLKSTVKTKYHPNGQVMSKTPYVNGKKHGIETVWYEDGSKEWEITWVEGKRHGLDMGRHENGDKEWLITWVDGKKHGVETEWWESDRKWSETTRKGGKRHGIITWWHRNGKKEKEIYYHCDDEYIAIHYDEEGNLTETNFQEPPLHSPPGEDKTKFKTNENHIIR